MKHLKAIILLFFLSAGTVLAQQMQVNEPLQPGSDFSKIDQCSRHHKEHKVGSVQEAEIHGNKNHSSNARVAASCTHTLGSIASMSSSQLVSFLKQTTDYDCHARVLIQFYTSYSTAIFSTENLIAVTDEIIRLAPSYNGRYSSGLYGLITYLHIAEYHKFFNPVIAPAFTEQFYTKFGSAMEAMANSPNLLIKNNESFDILREVLICFDTDGIRGRRAVLRTVKAVLDDLADNDYLTLYKNNKDMLYNLHVAYNPVFYMMFRGTAYEPAYRIAVSNYPEYITSLRKVAVLKNYDSNKDYSFISLNAALELSRKAEFPELIRQVEPELAAVCNAYPRLHPSWFRCVFALNKYGKCSPYNLCEPLAPLREELIKKLFPNNFVMDDGRMVVRTPLPLAKVKGLYAAAKQVNNQFFRITQTDEPVEGDQNASLTMMVFGSLAEYRSYATLLFNIDTNNGGMYIEQGATFYTWDRTVGVESTLSLEALFRHEYTHYLQGRYWIPGGWGESPLYNNSRMVWFEEGSAEFFAGSTDTDGIKLLAQSAKQLSSDSFISLSTLFQSSYTSGNYNHYYFGNMAFYNFYLNDFGRLKTLIDLTRSNNVSGFDQAINSLSSNGDPQWYQFLEQVKNGSVPSWEPSTNWKDDALLSSSTPEEMRAKFTNITGRTNVTASLDAAGLVKRYRLTGPITGSGAANDNASAAKSVSKAINELLVQLKNNATDDNFDYAVAYFKNLQFSGGVASADFIITGPLKGGVTDTTPPTTPTNLVASKVSDTRAQLDWTASTDNMYIYGYDIFNNGVFFYSSRTNRAYIDGMVKGNVYSFTVKAKDVSGNYSESSNAITVKPSYCLSPNDYTYQHATNVTFGTISNTTKIEKDSYGDYLALSAPAVRGATMNLSVTLNAFWNDSGAAAWIDWNQDEDFDDEGEQVMNALGSLKTNYTVPVVIPTTAVLGNTRMRIVVSILAGNEKLTPCVDLFGSETEDYTINVRVGIPDAEAPSRPSNLTASMVTANSAQLNWTASTDNIGVFGYTIYNGTTSLGIVNTNSFKVSGLNANTIYSFSVKALDANGNTSQSSDVVYITTSGGTNGTYCTVKNSTDGQYIANVTFGTINNKSEYSNNGYGDYTAISTAVNRGTTLNLTIKSPSANDKSRAAAWIDWNQDGDFVDDGEQVMSESGSIIGNFTKAVTVPTTALLGNTRMRIRTENTVVPYTSPCNDGWHSEVEDYTITVGNGSGSDTQAPTSPTNLVASAISQTGAQLNWTASSDNVGVTGYEIRVNNTLVALATTNTYNFTGLTASTTYSVSVTAKDAAGNSSAPSSISVTTIAGSITYCASAGGVVRDEFINQIQLGTINNQSGANAGYGNFTSLSTNLSIGNSYTIIVTPTWPGTVYSEGYAAWIDYNKDGDFADANEQIWSLDASKVTPATGTFTVPAGAQTGVTRLRISMMYNGTPTFCQAISYGEVEDYSVNIQSGSGDSQVPSAPSNLVASNITQTSVTLSWNASTDNVGVTGYDIFNGSTDIADASTTTFVVNGLTAATTYSFSIKAKDAAGNLSVASNIATITTTGSSSASYCAVTNGSSGQYVTKLVFGSINNTSAFSTDGYADYTTFSTTAAKGSTISLGVTLQSFWAASRAAVWIDWNKDGDFTDAGELVMNASGSSTSAYTVSVVVPATAQTGNTRMRVRAEYGLSSINPCGNGWHSEVEDYTIYLSSGATGPFENAISKAPAETSQVYPNPNEGVFTVKIPDTKSKTHIRIYNFVGHLIKSFEVENQSQVDIVLDVPAGMYTLRMQNNGNHSSHSLIIK